MPDVKELLKKFTKAYKKDLSRVDDEDPPRIPTGIFALDLASGGGVPVLRTTVIYGPQSSMKSTVALCIIGQAQQKYPHLKCVYMDIEGSYSKEWAKHMGVDTDALIVMTPETAEQTVDIVEQLLYADDICVIVVDSLAALTSQRELMASAEDAQMGVAGLMTNKLYRKTTRAMATMRTNPDLKSMPTLICINQIRFKMNSMHGDPEVMPGGPSFLFQSSLTLRLYGKDEFDKEVSSSLPAFKKVSIIIKKAKVPIVQRAAEMMVALIKNPKFNLNIGQAYDIATIMTYLKALGLLNKAEKAGQGWVLAMAEEHTFPTLDAIKERLSMDPKFSQEVRNTIIDRVLKGGDINTEKDT